MDLESQPSASLLGRSQEKYVYQAEAEVRSGFLRKVYGILGVQLLLSVALGAFFVRQETSWLFDHQWLMTLAMVGGFGFLLPLVCIPSLGRKTPWNYLLLAGFTASEGTMVGFVCGLYSVNSVLVAAGTTAGLFVVLSLIAFFVKIDFTKFYPYAVGLTLVLVFLGFFCVFFPTLRTLQVLYGAAAGLLFSGYIVMDTQMIANKGDRKFEVDDYVFAAIAIYLDLINVFLAILRIFGDRRRD